MRKLISGPPPRAAAVATRRRNRPEHRIARVVLADSPRRRGCSEPAERRRARHALEEIRPRQPARRRAARPDRSPRRPNAHQLERASDRALPIAAPTSTAEYPSGLDELPLEALTLLEQERHRLVGRRPLPRDRAPHPARRDDHTPQSRRGGARESSPRSYWRRHETGSVARRPGAGLTRRVRSPGARAGAPDIWRDRWSANRRFGDRAWTVPRTQFRIGVC